MRLPRVLLVLAASVIFSANLLAVTADPEAVIDLTQPDGSTITVRPVGDERTGRLVTIDGYTIIQSADNWYHYAELNAEGRLVPTDMRVTAADIRTPAEADRLESTPKNIRRSDDRLSPSLVSPEGDPIFSRAAQATVVNNNLLMILIKFPDESVTYQPPAFDDLMNQPGYFGMGSINDFYNEISYGLFGVNGNAVGWYVATNPRVYYEYGDGDNWTAAAELTREAILAADADGLDFSQYDNDGDGVVDGVFVIHGGPAAENGYNGYPWSHAWSLEGAGLSAVYTDGVKISGYSMEPEKHGPTAMVRIGVFCHEYGHMIGLPDLYDTDYSSIGIGDWGLMSGGSWNGPPGYAGLSPAHMTAWSKIRKGWATPINVVSDIELIWLENVEENPVIYRLWNEGALGPEYFLIEYRRQMMFDQYLPGCGLAVWHIDETINGNWDDAHRLVDLEERDGTENNNAGDMFLIDLFDDLSSPNSRAYDGSTSNVTVEVFSNQCTGAGLLISLSSGLGPCDSLLDTDGDGFNDCDDNCRFHYNPDQTDTNGDGIGDDCEDWDGDGLVNADDNCINTPNNDQADWDNDGVGDVCDDSDGDGVMDADDNCVTTYNPDQADWDSNNIGDLCDACCGRYTSGLTGNIDCSDDGRRNLSDITRLIDRVYISKLDLCCEENGNVDGDFESRINLADITFLIDHVYIRRQETQPCL